MSRLRVRLRGKVIQDISLSQERSYIAGRKEDCDILLESEKGISREHFKVSFNDGAWSVDLVSRYGDILVNGEKSSQFTLEDGIQFSVPPYEFEFLQTSDVPHVLDASGSSLSANLPVLTAAGVPEVFAGSEERTVVGPAPMSAYIKILDSQNEAQELINLAEGDSWLAGRDSSCDIQIQDQRVSRRQFEIRRNNGQYYIMDLGSVNGTLLNGTPLSSTDLTPLKSGDAIHVLSNYLYFELRDLHYENRLQLVQIEPVSMSVAEYQPPGAHEIAPYMPTPTQNDGPLPTAYLPPQPPPVIKKQGFDFEKNRPKVIGAAAVILVLAFLFSGEKKDEKPVAAQSGAAAPGSSQEAFAKLSAEQQALIKQRYKDAKNLYMQGKYQLAQDEIVKIQGIVPDYEDIKEIERLSKEAIFIQEQQRRQEQLEQAKIEMEEKIQKQTAVCEKQINPSVTMAQLDECLSSVIEFNPEHPKILSLKSQVEAILAKKEAEAAQRAAYQAQVAKLRGIFEKAQLVAKTGKPLDAIEAYEKVLRTQLPDPNGYKIQSQRTIASLRQGMNSKTASLQAEAKKYYEAQNLKAAILSLRKARALDPDNPELPEIIEQYTLELRKNMMVIYQEGILEENFGRVDGDESKAGAKDKWKKILQLDVPDGEYYRKAVIKLKKYGAM